MNIEDGFCQCGCGERVGHTRGKANKYLKGHNRRGTRSPKWKGGRIIDSNGYIFIWMPSHPRAHNGYVAEHIVVVERSFGRQLLKTDVYKNIGLATKSGVSDKRIGLATKYINKRQNQPKNDKERQSD